MFSRGLQIAVVVFVTPLAAKAVNPAHWTIVEQVNRTDTSKTWFSPTAIDLGKMAWVYEFEITKVTGTVNVPLFGPITVDITSSIPAEDRVGSGEVRNLPATLFNESFSDAGSGSSADIFLEINNAGFAHAEFTNIVLGSVEVPLFGVRPVQRINVEASVDITGYNFGDYNRDFVIDAADYVVWRGTVGQMGENLLADGSGNQEVDDPDYGVWQSRFGPSGGGGAESSLVPEPTSALLVCMSVAGLCFGRLHRGPIERPRLKTRAFRAPRRNSGRLEWQFSAAETRDDRFSRHLGSPASGEAICLRGGEIADPASLRALRSNGSNRGW